MAYPYHYDDVIYDIESKPDVFTDAQFYPAQNKLIISVIQDSELMRLNQDETFNKQDQQVIIDRIRAVNPVLKDTHIVIENLRRVPTYDEWQKFRNYQIKQNDLYRQGKDFTKLKAPNNAEYSLIGWAHRLGVGNQDVMGANKRNKWGEPEDNEYNNFMTRRGEMYSHRLYRSEETGESSPGLTKPYDYRQYNSSIPISTLYGSNYELAENDPNLKAVFNHTDDFYAQYYPIKKTDAAYDSDNPALNCGLRLGYNSTNYDMTMLAKILASIEPSILNSAYNKVLEPTAQILKHNNSYVGNADAPVQNGIPSAQVIRSSMNDTLFSQYLDNMWNFIKFGTPDYYIKKGWSNTNRYLDVSKFNEHQRKVSLKRISGMMGLQIKESANLGDDDATVDTLDNLAELVAYNVSDVYNTKKLFDDPVYQDGFQLKQSLIDTYPAVAYQQSKESDNIQNTEADGTINYGRKAIVDPMRIRSDRLCDDDSSAKFIANVISPFEKLEDNPVIDLHYPAQDVLNEIKQQKALGKAYTDRTIRDKPYDVLEDTADWVYGRGYYKDEGPHMGPNGQKEFEKIYAFYDAFRGMNVNNDMSLDSNINKYGSKKALDKLREWCRKHPEHLNKYFMSDNMAVTTESDFDIDIKAIMREFDTNVFYMNGDDEKTSSIANLSIGGIHGSEIKLDDYRKAEAEYHKEQDHQVELWNAYNGDLKRAYKENEKHFKFEDGTEVEVRKMFMSKSTGKRVFFKKPKFKSLFAIDSASKIEKLRKEYTYVSVDKASHEDFSSYYPTLLTMLAVFRDPDDGSDVYADVYHERLALKAKLKTLEFGSPEYKSVNLQQNLRKLLLNSASGAGDATFESNIKMNNATISMRIIGQLFAWRIGQAEANHGARVPSTNTDGLYVMGIDPEVNDKVLFHTVDPMLINIDPEIVDRFVSKDANNRVEVDGNEIQEAKGGTLRSWQGPDPQNNLNHPAICDTVLAHYLAFKPTGHNPSSPSDQPFDREYARKILNELLMEGGSYAANKVHKLKLLQWVLASGMSTHRHNFYQQFKAVESDKDNDRSNDEMILQYDGDEEQAKLYGGGIPCAGIAIPRTNRVFMVKKPKPGTIYNTVKIVTKRKVPAATIRKRIKEWKKANPDSLVKYGTDEAVTDPLYEDPINVQMMTHYVKRSQIESEFHDQQEGIVTAKVTEMPERQPIIAHNQAVSYFTDQEYLDLIHQLDLDAYLDIVESKFNNSWKN